MAKTDEPVTRISRDEFTARTASAIHSRGEPSTLGVLVARVGKLHRINATFGHAFSEKIIIDLGFRLRDILRDKDQLHLIADDEYGLILPRLANRGHAELAANKALSIVTEPFCFGGMMHNVSITVGIATTTDSQTDAEQLLQRAELALANAEDNHQSYAAYRDVAALATTAAWDAEMDLAEAIQNSELELYYQPQFGFADNRVCGAEGLMRWHHPRRGFLMPNAFIDAAEHSAQIRTLTWSALNMALQRASEWPAFASRASVAVNISALVLSNPEFVAMVTDAAGIWGIDADRLVLEITETALMQELDKSHATLQRLHDIGFTVSIDDFGTGYSSFAYFRDLPAREVKIDKQFVFRMLESHKDRNIVASLIELAHKFDLRVVAEGVTDEATLKVLRDLNCDIAQGYYFAEPMTHRDFVAYLEQDNQRAASH